METPFIARFRTPRNYYIYDVNTNGFLRVNEVVYDVSDYFGYIPEQELIEKLSCKHSREVVQRALSEVTRSQRQEGVFSTFRPERLHYPMTRGEIEDILNKGMQQLILSVTEQCNLRCRYCVFSGAYQYQRTHASRWMSFETARKAIDLFMKCSVDTELPALGFYGGEPLLAFNLIRKVINYTNQRYERKLNLHITTNGTLLSSDVASFIVKNEIAILVSLDGPPQIHDNMRVYPDGRGTFSTILRNLRALKDEYPEFYERKVAFNVCLSSPDDMEEVYKFFTENEDIFSGKRLVVSHVGSIDTDLFKNGVLVPAEGWQMKQSARRFVETIILGREPDMFLKALYEIPLVRIHQRCFKPLSETHYPNGICTPGVRRLFCTMDGDLTLCERVNPGLNIGHVDRGIDYDAALELAHRYAEMSSPDCRNCWAIRFCSACYCQLYRDRYDINKKENFCPVELIHLLKMMSMYCAAREENDHAFDYMDEISLT